MSGLVLEPGAGAGPSAASRRADAPPAAAAPRELLARALARAEASDASWVRVVVPVPTCSPLPLLDLWPHLPAVAWAPRDGGVVLVGLDAAAEVRGRGPDRFAALQAGAAGAGAVEVIWADDAAAGRAPLEASALRYYGGAAFSAGGADAAPWTGFGDAWFFLPRWLLVQGDAGAVLTVTVRPSEASAPGWLDQAEVLLAAATATAREPGRARVVDRDDGAATTWHQQVDAVRAAIGRGELDKAIIARTTRIELDASIAPAAVLRALDRQHPECTRFALRPAGGPCLLGASPERLIRKRGATVASEALAGSIPRDGDDERARLALLGDGKERWEHALVVDAIAGALGPRCRSLPVPAAPSVRTLRHVHHLRTELAGTLADDEGGDHVLALAARLHPTPAVGGWPTAPALAMIAATERQPRGWYASPVGWFEPGGDGELVVAIRSALLHERAAYVWAGAGIVAASDPAREWRETRVKQRAVLGALGVDDVGASGGAASVDPDASAGAGREPARS
ncbi:MAG: isochorismate synthase [Kofleriaceae bacterium]|nr:isochorismate synthase [Kofleriaceae bacterium]